MILVLALHACKSMTTRGSAVMENGRLRINLNGQWLIAFDPQNAGEQQGRANEPPVDVSSIAVPGAWQSTKAGVGYNGVAWYYKSFDIPAEMTGRLRLCFEDVNYHAKVWLNGRYVGEHEGGYVPFGFEVGATIRPGLTNDLVVRVTDTPRLEYVDGLNLYQVPHAKESWYVNFGGLCGNVYLTEHDDAWIENVFLIPDVETPAIIVQCTLGADAGAQPFVLAASVSSAKDDNAEYGSASFTVDPGKHRTFALKIPLREKLLWSPEHPFLYRVSVRLVRGQIVLDRAADTAGLRKFDVRDNNFYLNGRRVILNAVINQPFFPDTLCRPPNEEWCEKQVRLIKEAGFNAVLNHVRLAPEEFLREADRQGLLVFQQPSIGRMYCRDNEALQQRLTTQIGGMILRDRNHPSIVMWGIFNEGSAPQLLSDPPEHARKFAKLIGRLDPTRPILDKTAAGRARCYPAGSNENIPCFDAFWYPSSPMPDNQRRHIHKQLEQHGRKELAVIIGYGAGGITALDAAVEGYEKPCRFKGDYRYFAQLRHKLRKSVKSRPLKRKFGSIEDFVAALQRHQARAAREQSEMLACNPDLDMLCFTQWQDCIMESTAGLVNVWGDPKPAWHAFRALNAPTRLVLRVPRSTVFIGEDIAVEPILLNKPGMQGAAVLSIELNDAFGNTVSDPEFHLQLSGERVQGLGRLVLGSPRAEGRHTISARLVHFGEGINSFGGSVLAISREAAAVSSPVTLYDPEEKLKASVGGRHADTNNLQDCEKVHPVIVAASLGNAPPPVAARFFAAVEDGAWGILLAPPGPGEPLHLSGLLSPEVVRTAAPPMGSAFYGIAHPIFEGLPIDAFFGREYGNVVPGKCMVASEHFRPAKSWDSICGAVSGSDGFVGHCVLIMPMGNGSIILSTLNLADNLGSDPLAARVLANMIRHAEAASGRTSAQPVPHVRARALQAEYERLLAEQATRRRGFLIVGPWPLEPDNGNGSSFDMVLPPEKDLDPGATYASWDNRRIQWQETEVSAYGRLVLPPEFRKRFMVAYAYAYVRCPEATTADLVVSSATPIKVWFDAREKYPATDPMTRLRGHKRTTNEIRSRVRIRRGLNHLLIKFGWAGNPSHVNIRFLRNGRQLPNLEYIAPKDAGLAAD
ncbi:MAG: hypothetical protein HQ592_18210 [Planctomycetes bacterium]|nr:hypothetical protein [Planctomycetota bacterium]